MKIRNGTMLCLIVLGPIAMAEAPGNANPPIGSPETGALQQTATRQEQIRSEAKLLVTRLDDVLAEYTRNGLAKGEDFEDLKQVRAELGSLTDEEMLEVVGLLTHAAGDPGQMAKAYAGQKDISLRLKQILAAHGRQQDIDALASAVRQLADRQSANLSAAIDATRLAAQDKSADGQAAVKASEQAQQSEQSAIGEEVKLVVGKLGKMDGDAKYQDAAAQLEKVPPEAYTASDALGAGRLDDAAAAEQAAREQLEEVVRALAPAGKQEPPQNQEADQLTALARDQRALLARTTQASTALQKVGAQDTPEAADKDMYDQIKSPASPLSRKLALSELTPSSPIEKIRANPAMKLFLDARSARLKAREQALQSQMAALSGDQAALAAKAQMVRDDLQKTEKDAGAPMANALTQMNSAQEALAEGDGDQAAQEETDAANQLDQAQRLAEQGSASQAQAAAPAGREQQLQQLQNGVKDLAGRETTSVQQGDALKTGAMAAAAADLQANLAGKAQALRQAAADAAPASVPALRQAADALQNAAQTMQAGSAPTQAEAAQQSALQNLAQAGQQLAQQAAAAARQKQELADLENQMAGLGKVIQQQRQLGLETEKAVDAGKAVLVKTRQFAREQANIQSEAQKMRPAVNPETPEAAKALDRADVAMGDAARKLNAAGADEAEPRQQAALAALYEAQDALVDREQKLAQDLGQPAAQGGPQATLAASAALGKAQTQTASAQDAMDSGAPGDAAMHKLDQAAHAVAQAGAQPQALPQGARDALRAAEQALDSAAAAAGAGQGQQAQAQAAQAAQALSRAQSAIAGAQAGIAQLSPASGAPGQAQAPGANSQGSEPGAQTGQGAKPAREKSWNDTSGAATAGMQGAHGEGAYIGLPDRDRAAIQQSQAEKYPQEYGAMIEEYMRSLASDAGGK
jgi:hypothetical protein